MHIFRKIVEKKHKNVVLDIWIVIITNNTLILLTKFKIKTNYVYLQ